MNILCAVGELNNHSACIDSNCVRMFFITQLRGALLILTAHSVGPDRFAIAARYDLAITDRVDM